MRNKPQLRTVMGNISTTGLIAIPGTADWTVVKVTTAQYQFRYDRPFKSYPIITFGPTLWGIVIVGASDLTGFLAICYTGGGSAQDTSFNFMAVGYD